MQTLSAILIILAASQGVTAIDIHIKDISVSASEEPNGLAKYSVNIEYESATTGCTFEQPNTDGLYANRTGWQPCLHKPENTVDHFNFNWDRTQEGADFGSQTTDLEVELIPPGGRIYKGVKRLDLAFISCGGGTSHETTHGLTDFVMVLNEEGGKAGRDAAMGIESLRSIQVAACKT